MGDRGPTIEPPSMSPAKPPSHDNKFGADWSDVEKVEYLYLRNWSVNRIMRKLGVTPDMLEALLEAVDAKIEKRISLQRAKVVRQHYGFHEELATVALDSFNKLAKQGRHAPSFLRIASESKATARKIYALDEPVKTVSVNVDAKVHALFKPEVNARIMSDPEAREAFLKLEEFASNPRKAIDKPDVPVDVTPPAPPWEAAR